METPFRWPMRGALRLAGFALLSACSSQRLESAVEPIQGGTLDTTHTFSMGLIIDNRSLCSGTLIAPNLILTARHCIAGTPTSISCASATFGTNVAPSVVVASTCSDVLSPSCTTWYRVQQIATPSATTFCGQDIALLELSSNVTGVTPATPLLTPLTDPAVMGQAFTAIGFGRTNFAEANSSGVRRILPNVSLTCVPGYGDPAYDCNTVSNWPYPSEEFLGGGGLCPGDSGSSVFEQRSFDLGTVLSVGVASRARRDAQDNCVSSVYTRTDVHAALIRAAANHAAVAGGYAPPSWAATPDADAGAVTPPADAAPLAHDASVDAAADASTDAAQNAADAGTDAMQDSAAQNAADAATDAMQDSAAQDAADAGTDGAQDALAPDAAGKDAAPSADAGGPFDAAPPPRDAVSSPSPSELVTDDAPSDGGCQTAHALRPGHASWLVLAVALAWWRKRFRRDSTR